jgi:hypothetical protein
MPNCQHLFNKFLYFFIKTFYLDFSDSIIARSSSLLLSNFEDIVQTIAQLFLFIVIFNICELYDTLCYLDIIIDRIY